MRVFWLAQPQESVPTSDLWLSAEETARCKSFVIEKRRHDWRLGRWTAKQAVAACLSLPCDLLTLSEIEIRPAPDGAPEAFLRCEAVPLTISISHCHGRGLCVVASGTSLLGCDMEYIEDRGESFVADYFTRREQDLIASSSSSERNLLVTLLWSAKESALKATREGLRADTRIVEVDDVAFTPHSAEWKHLDVRCPGKRNLHGWWRECDGLVYTIVADPAPLIPCILEVNRTIPGHSEASSTGGRHGHLISH